jgi:hypothetical protein
MPWNQVCDDADCTHVRGRTALPSVAKSRHAYALAQPADELWPTKVSLSHWYHSVSLAACEHAPSSTSRSSVGDEQLLPVPRPPPAPSLA